MFETTAQIIINGLLIGGVYSLISIGLALIFGVMSVINFAHGEFLMLAMYTSFWLFNLCGIDPYLSLFITVPFLFLVGVATQKVIIQPILEAPHIMQLLATFGLAIALENGALLMWGGDYRTINLSYAGRIFEIGGVLINYSRLLTFLISISLTGILFVFLKKTYIGKAIRATAQHRKGAMLMGVNVNQICQITFGIGAACVGVSGAVLVQNYAVFPTIGAYFVFISFLVVILSGGKNLFGVFICGLLVGLLEAFSGYFLVPALKSSIYFIIFIIVLLFKPEGLFGK